GVRVFAGEGRFTDAETVAVDGYDVKARRFVIATGSSAALPAIPGLADTPHLTNETIFDLAECPRHLIVIGADSIGLELAQAFRRFGADVTVLEPGVALADADRECASVVVDALAREGVVLYCGVEVRQVHRSLARVQVDIVASDDAERKIQTIDGSHLLVAVGRRPNLEDLDLDAAGIRYQPSGIVVDRGLRTTNKQVYAIGDVTGAPQLSHLAHHQAGLVIRNALFRTPVDADRYAVPVVTYTDPELAQVGLTEDEARAQAGVIRVLRAPYRENDRARANGATSGHVKIVTDRKGGILGATIVGAAAAENIAAWTLAINQKLNIEAFAGVIVPYPSYAEVGKRAAMTYFTRGLTSPLVRRIIGWLRRFG
ncbi:MAG: FAD-dependent oxidoreductase, partial [Xanthobacteraceae bacterium]